MSKTIKYISLIIFAIALIIPIWFLINNIQPLGTGLYSFAILCIIAIAVILRLFTPRFVKKVFIFIIEVTQYKYFILITIPLITLIAIFVRLYIYAHFSYLPVSDPVTFYDTAQSIANGQGIHGNSYPAFFPYLAAYDYILGFAMKIISNPWLATIILNTFFDIGAATVAYYLVKKLSKASSKLPVLIFAVWLLSPFNILFSVISLPIIIVNFFIITTIFLVYIFIKNIASRKIVLSLVVALLLGVTVAIGNCFRPVFTVVLVAIFLLFVYSFITSESKRYLLPILASSFILILVLFFGFQKLDLSVIAKDTGFTPPKNDSGWSIYIGSNSATNGTWNLADQDRMSQICKNQNSFEDCQEKLQNVGIERYKSYGVSGTINLFIRKLYIFSSDQSSTYNANDSLTNYANSTVQKVMNIYITLFITVLFFLSARYMYYATKITKLKNEVIPIALFIALLMAGFFLSDIFVETAERYAQIMYPLFILTSVLSLTVLKKQQHTPSS